MITLKFEISWLLNLVYIIYCGCRNIVAVELSIHKLWQLQMTSFPWPFSVAVWPPILVLGG